jgi:hypothetical protein
MATDAAAAKCYAHYRAAVGSCATCGRGLCAECSERAAGGPCPDCRERERAHAEAVRLQREARAALRRAGVAVPRRGGEPIVLRGGHPLANGLVVGASVLVGLGLGALATLAEITWGVPRAGIAPALALAVGSCVSAIFGGTSRPAGIFAMLLYLFAVGGGPDALSMVRSGVALPGPSHAAAWLDAHGAVALACYAVSAPLAYVAAAGRRVG